MKSAALALLALLAVASPEPRFFHYERPVLNTPATPAQTCLALDPAIFPHAAPQLVDLRLFHGATETPYALRTATSVKTAQGWIQPLNVGLRDGHTVFDAAMPQGRYADLNLNIPAQDFIATVTVWGSHTQTAAAQTRLGAFTIFDLTGQKLGRSTVLHLPVTDLPYLHFSIAGPLTPADVHGLSAGRQPAGPVRYTTVTATSQVAQRPRASVIEFTVPPRTPVDRVVFVPGPEPAAFSRDVTVTVTPLAPPATDQSVPPEPIPLSGNLLRLHRTENGEHLDEERLELPTIGQTFDSPAKWTIAVQNGDDPPLPLQSVRLEMQQRDLCFQAAGAGVYTLFYGDPALSPPQYDYATLFTPEPSPSQVAAGPEQPNPGFQPRPDLRPFTEKHPALLWITLIAAIVVLAGIALRSASHTTARAADGLGPDNT